MKKLLLTIALILGMIAVIQAQEPKKPNTTVDSAGNYISINSTKSTSTGKTYIDSKGIKYPVYISANKKLFIIAKSAKTGKEYKRYLIL